MIHRGFMFEERPNEAIDVPIEDEKSPSSKLRESSPRQANARNDARGSGSVRGQDVIPAIRECTFAGFMKCNPITFHGTKGAVELRRWFEKKLRVFLESVMCYEGKKVKFAAATLQGPTLTWCLLDHFLCVNDVLLAMLGHVRSSVTSVERLGIRQVYCKVKMLSKAQEKVREVCGRAYAIKDVEPQGPNVVTVVTSEDERCCRLQFARDDEKGFIRPSSSPWEAPVRNIPITALELGMVYFDVPSDAFGLTIAPAWVFMLIQTRSEAIKELSCSDEAIRRRRGSFSNVEAEVVMCIDLFGVSQGMVDIMKVLKLETTEIGVELLSYYDCEIGYSSWKMRNVVADALVWKEKG
ncbi:hypothetical protein Tco_1577547 [Tanacetum coccineum]